MRITSKIIVAFLFLALFPLAVASFFSFMVMERELTAQTRNTLEALAKRQADRLDAIANQNLERISHFTSKVQLRLLLDRFNRQGEQKDQEALTAIVRDTHEALRGVRDIFVFNANGVVVAATDTAAVGQRLFNDALFAYGREGNGVSFFLRDAQERLRFFIAGPLLIEERLIGVAAMEVEYDEISASARDYTGLGSTGETYLAMRDSSGDALFVAPTRGDSLAALRTTVKKDAIREPIIRALANEEAFFTDLVDYRGKEVFAATRSINTPGWGLAVKIDKTEVLASLWRLRNAMLAFSAVFTILVALAAISFARIIMKPILALTAAARRMQAGDLMQHLKVTSKDEIGQLTAAFNTMAANLRVSYVGLQQKTKELTRQLETIKAQNAEFERLHQLTIDRELHMIELKKELEELRKEHGRTTTPPPSVPGNPS